MGNADGWVTIGTKLDTKQLEKDLKDEQRRLQQFEKEAEKLTAAKSKVELDLQEYEKQKQLINESTNEMLKFAQTEEQVNEVLNLENAELEKLNDKYSNQFIKLEEINKKIEENAHNQALVKNEISETNAKLSQVKGFDNIKNSIDKVGKSVEGVTKKVARWALAIFGIRSAYMFVRQAMSTLSQYDEQMAVNIEWIRYLLASVLKPVIEGLINLVYKLLAYVNYIAQAWFGVNLFANASTKAFEKQHKAIGKSGKKAKELQKTLAGFDEMNVLQDNKNTGDTGGGSGVSLPSFPKMDKIEMPGWVDWIAKNKDIVLAALAGIAAGLLAIKFELKGIEALGIGIAIAGVVMLIQDIIKFIKDPSWQNFVNILGDIAIIIGGIMLVMGNWWGLLVVLVGLAVKLIANNWGAIKGILGTVGKWINNTIIKPVANFFKGLWDGIKNGAKAVVNFVKNVFSGIINFFKSIISSIVGLFKTVGKKVGDVIGGAFKGVINGVLGAIESILNAPIRAINGLIGVINKVPGINLGRLDTFNLPRLARGGIVNNPGPGVMMGSYIAGERGPEAVIPLDDQTLDRLGEAFARHTVINASITNTMNGRVLSRELQKVQNSSDFAYNR